MFSEDVILEIEGNAIKCKKSDLILNSDYFKAMFAGNFVEKNKSTIVIQGVHLNAMNIILTLLLDDMYYIEDDDIIDVLQAACMLQFGKIQSMCVLKATEILSPRNCLKIWLKTELLDLKPLNLKAKRLAITEFMFVKDTNSILEVDLKQLQTYLGNANLVTDSELTVFQTAMKWWYENAEMCEKPSDLYKLLSCISYRDLSNNHFKEMLAYPDIANSDVGDVLTCIYNIINDITTTNVSEMCLHVAKLLSETNTRHTKRFMSFMVDSYPCVDETKSTKSEINNLVVCYDYRYGKFQKFFSIIQKLVGFSLLGYKEFIFMYGGEFLIGRGEWNYNFWAYDSIREKWLIKSKLPFPRRHFETCIVGSKIFITGGTGPFRINQENVFFYDFKEDKWSKQIPLPLFDRQLKSCEFLNKFFIFSVNNNCGYFFHDLDHWSKIELETENNILNIRNDFSIFSIGNSLYIKGKMLLEFAMVDYKLVLLSSKKITDLDYDSMVCTNCNNLAYTLYKYRIEDTLKYSLEQYDVCTNRLEFIFKDVSENDSLQLGEEMFTINHTLKMFTFDHHILLEDDELINTSF